VIERDQQMERPVVAADLVLRNLMKDLNHQKDAINVKVTLFVKVSSKMTVQILTLQTNEIVRPSCLLAARFLTRAFFVFFGLNSFFPLVVGQ